MNAKRRGSDPRDPCLFVGCGNIPTGRKPYCIEHLDRIPGAADLMREVERREAEIARAALGQWRHIDTAGSVAEEILDLLRAEGPLRVTTILSKIVFDVDGEEQRRTLVLGYCRALGLAVEAGRDDRGHRFEVVSPPVQERRAS